MTKVRYIPDHPVVFVFDYENHEVEIPEYDPEKTVSSNDSCASIRTVADVDGDVTIGLDDPVGFNVRMTEAFVGTIKAPNGKIAIVNSENEKLLETDLASQSTSVRISVDNLDHPTKVMVETSG